MTDEDRVSETFGCERCWPAGADEAWTAKRDLSTVADLVDESHYGVSILACPACAQRLVLVFAETIDWAGGDDPQTTTLMPVTEEEAAALGRRPPESLEGFLGELGPGRRCLLHLYPAGSDGKQNFWRTGIVVGPHE